MGVMFDSCVWVGLAANQLDRQTVLDACGDALVFTSVISLGELSFGMLAAAVKQSGRSPRPRYNDLWIAAQAIEHGHILLTLNARDFAGLPGLRLIELQTKAQA